MENLPGPLSGRPTAHVYEGECRRSPRYVPRDGTDWCSKHQPNDVRDRTLTLTPCAAEREKLNQPIYVSMTDCSTQEGD